MNSKALLWRKTTSSVGWTKSPDFDCRWNFAAKVRVIDHHHLGLTVAAHLAPLMNFSLINDSESVTAGHTLHNKNS
jgi:hypothetical protein